MQIDSIRLKYFNWYNSVQTNDYYLRGMHFSNIIIIRIDKSFLEVLIVYKILLSLVTWNHMIAKKENRLQH